MQNRNGLTDRLFIGTSSKGNEQVDAQAILKYGHLTIMGTLDGLSADQVNVGGVCGVWTVRDIVAHLASFEHVLVDLLNSFIASAPTPRLDEFIQMGNAFNDALVARTKNSLYSEVLADYTAACEQTMQIAAKISPDKFRENGTLPWYGADYSLDDFIVYTYYGHKREHGAQIAAFRDSLQ